MSKPVVVSIPHELGRAEARRRIEEGVGTLTSQIGAVGDLKQAWEGDTLRFSLQAIGQTVTGLIAVAEREVRLEVTLPGIFGMIAGKVRSRLQSEGQILLGPSKGGRG
jgi:putative polyhydroxyalkanoate system protein